MIARILYYNKVCIVNDSLKKNNTPRFRAYHVERMEHIDYMCAPKGMLYIEIIEGREGADNLNCLVVNDAHDRTRARGDRPRRINRLWDCVTDSAHAAEPEVIE